jgi:hypothetical protein
MLPVGDPGNEEQKNGKYPPTAAALRLRINHADNLPGAASYPFSELTFTWNVRSMTRWAQIVTGTKKRSFSAEKEPKRLLILLASGCGPATPDVPQDG